MMNSRKSSDGDIASLIAEIDGLVAEVATVEHAGAPLDQRIHDAIAELDADAAFFLEHGWNDPLPAGSPVERQRAQLRALKGGVVVAGGRELLIGAIEKRERQRWKRAGSRGYTEEEKTGRLAELGRDLRQARARLEIAWRRQVQAGVTPTRGERADAECYLADDASLAQIAATGSMEEARA